MHPTTPNNQRIGGESVKTKLVILVAMLMLVLVVAGPAFARGPAESCRAFEASGGQAPQCPGVSHPGKP